MPVNTDKVIQNDFPISEKKTVVFIIIFYTVTKTPLRGLGCCCLCADAHPFCI